MLEKCESELLKLDYNKRWRYLKRYYDLASAFYDIRDTVVSEEEINDCIAKLKRKPQSIIRREIRLNDWHFMLDMQDEGVKQGYFSGEYDETCWGQVTIPHAYSDVPERPVKFGRTNNAMYAAEADLGEYCDILRGDSCGWYKCRLRLEELKKDEIAYLSFESVNLKSDVWVNEYPVMTDHLGLFPFKMEITDELKAFYSTNPVIVVRVENIASNIPAMFYNGFQFDYSDADQCTGRHEMDWKNNSSAGIADEVKLSIVNKNHIENVFIHTDEIADNNAKITLDMELKNNTWTAFRGTVGVEISPWLPKEGDVVKNQSVEAIVLPMNDGKATISIAMENCDLWTNEAPHMYLAHIVLFDEYGGAIDDVFETFGVRTIKIKGSHLYLNGRKFVPRGTHDVCHYFGEAQICPGDEIIVKDLLLHKKMGANCSRWPSDARLHYQKIADYCDQLGFMLSWTGYFEVWNIHSEAELLASRDVKAMVRSLRNHPSIIVWEMGDEVLNFSHESRRMRWFDMMYKLVSAEDKTRPIIPSGDWSSSLIGAIRNHGDANLTMEEKRKHALEEFPVYDQELALWDVHDCPYYPPFNPIIEPMDRIVDALGEYKPVIFTEFGTDGMPAPEKVMDIYEKFRWKANPFYLLRRETLDRGCFGRDLTLEDWKESQAFQALTVVSLIDRLRQYPETFAAIIL